MDEATGQAATVVSVNQEAVEQVIAAALETTQQTGEAQVLHFPDIQPLEDNSVLKLELPSEQMRNAAQEGLGVSVRMENTTFEVPSGVIGQAAEDSTSLSLECREADEDSPAFRIDGGDGTFIGPAYQYALSVTRVDGETGYLDQFEQAVTVVVQLTPEQAAAIVDQAAVTMCYVNPITGKTEVLPSVYDPETMTLTFMTIYFAEAAEE